MSLPVLGVRGWLNPRGLDVFGKRGQIEASSSAMNVDCDGEVVSESGSCRKDASEAVPGRLLIFTRKFLFQMSREFTAICDEQNVSFPSQAIFLLRSSSFSAHFSQLKSISTNQAESKSPQTLNEIETQSSQKGFKMKVSPRAEITRMKMTEIADGMRKENFL
jgi:hypothetical protein